MFISYEELTELQISVKILREQLRDLRANVINLNTYREELPDTHPIFVKYNEISFKDLFKLILENMGLSVIKHPSEYVLEKKEVDNG